MKEIEKIINEQTYKVIDHPSNRFNFCDLIEVTEELAEEASWGSEYNLSDELPEDVQLAVDTMIDNDVIIADYTTIVSYEYCDDTIYLLSW